MKTNMIKHGLVPVLLLGLFSGCVNIEKSYPDQHYFVLEVNREAGASNPGRDGVLEVADMRVSPRFAEKSFVYRTSETRYESDFYNQFLTAPGSLITEEIRKGLVRSHVFRHVIGSSSQLQPTHVLEGAVSALYGDFRDRGAPQAILEMEFFLSKANSAGSDILVEKRYAKSIPLDGRSPEALVRGWNKALDEILAALAADLKAVQ